MCPDEPVPESLCNTKMDAKREEQQTESKYFKTNSVNVSLQTELILVRRVPSTRKHNFLMCCPSKLLL